MERSPIRPRSVALGRGGRITVAPVPRAPSRAREVDLMHCHARAPYADAHGSKRSRAWRNDSRFPGLDQISINATRRQWTGSTTISTRERPARDPVDVSCGGKGDSEHEPPYLPFWGLLVPPAGWPPREAWLGARGPIRRPGQHQARRWHVRGRLASRLGSRARSTSRRGSWKWIWVGSWSGRGRTETVFGARRFASRWAVACGWCFGTNCRRQRVSTGMVLLSATTWMACRGLRRRSGNASYGGASYEWRPACIRLLGIAIRHAMVPSSPWSAA
jgi:hypothetical protein